MDFFANNYQWLFSGLGAAILVFILGKILKSKHKHPRAIKQSTTGSSNVIQVGGNFTQGKADDKPKSN